MEYKSIGLRTSRDLRDRQRDRRGTHIGQPIMSTMRALAKEAPATEIPALVTSFEEHRASLAERKNYRDAKKINDRLPDAAATLVEVPRRKHFPATEEGRLEWRAKFNKHAGGFSHAHVSMGTARQRHGDVGMFGDYLEREGHGTFVQWQKERRSGGRVDNVVVPILDETTQHIKVPDAEAVAEYVMVMAIGDTTARPKGGTLEYRSAWHHGKQPKALYLTEKKHGRGAYANTPIRFVSIEKMKEAISQFYDKHLQVKRASRMSRQYQNALKRQMLTDCAVCACARACCDRVPRARRTRRRGRS